MLVLFYRDDELVLTRMFGPQIDADCPVLADLQPVRHVSWRGSDDSAAVSLLVQAVVSKGVEGYPMGWTLARSADESSLFVQAVVGGNYAGPLEDINGRLA